MNDSIDIKDVLKCILEKLGEMAKKMASESMWYYGFKEMTFQAHIYDALSKKSKDKSTRATNIPYQWARSAEKKEIEIVQLEFPIYPRANGERQKRADIVILPSANDFDCERDSALMTIEMKWNDHYAGSVKPDINKLESLNRSDFKLFILINSPKSMKKIYDKIDSDLKGFIGKNGLILYVGKNPNENGSIIVGISKKLFKLLEQPEDFKNDKNGFYIRDC